MIPSGAVPGSPLVVSEDGASIDVGEPQGPTVYRIPHTWVWSGTILVPSGGTGWLGGIFVPVPPGQYATLVVVWAKVRGGTSATFKIQQNGSDISSLTGLVASTSKSYTVPTDFIDINDGDELEPVVTSLSGTPDGLQISLFVEYQSEP